jgi:hypothetical protein
MLTDGAYQVVAVGFNSTDKNGNLIVGSPGPTLNGAGAITFTGATYDSNTTIDNPSTCVACQAAPSPQNHQFDAGTFIFTTPEPGSLLLVGSGLVLAAARRWLRRFLI